MPPVRSFSCPFNIYFVLHVHVTTGFTIALYISIADVQLTALDIKICCEPQQYRLVCSVPHLELFTHFILSFIKAAK
jgi:hypothetical protein